MKLQVEVCSACLKQAFPDADGNYDPSCDCHSYWVRDGRNGTEPKLVGVTVRIARPRLQYLVTDALRR